MEQIRQLANSLVSQITVRSSVLNPLLWLCAVAGIVFLAAAWLMVDYRGCLIFCAVMPFFAAIFYYAYFAHTDPNRLQSEEFQTRHQELLLASKTSADIPFSVDAQIEDHDPEKFLPQELDTADDMLLVEVASSDEGAK